MSLELNEKSILLLIEKIKSIPGWDGYFSNHVKECGDQDS